jgi:hypothetical protein
MFEISIYDNTTKKKWTEYFDSYYLFKRRYNKLRFSKKLFIISRSNLYE